jgi:MFS family permease
MGRLWRLYHDHERIADIAFFAGGFLFDVFTLTRVDAWAAIAQQVLYLGVAAAILLDIFLDEGRPARRLEELPRLKRWYFEYRQAAVHFLLGALLSVYTLFFFKSSSLFVSFAFLLFLVLVLVVNESQRFKRLGLPFKFALLSLCLLSFSAIVVPVLIGSIGTVVFLLSMLVGAIPLALILRRIRARAPERSAQARRQIAVPFGLVLIGFLTLYLLRLIPPVPLSIPFMGVYHGVERTEAGFQLTRQAASWRFWRRADEHFEAQPGDRLFVFFRIFSPTRFSDEVAMLWYWKPPGGRWELQDRIPIAIVGGRAEGFRGYGVKSNYQPGDWKVAVETTDGREIGRTYFVVTSVPEGPRLLDTTVQ